MQLFSADGTVFLKKFKKPSSNVAHNSNNWIFSPYCPELAKNLKSIADIGLRYHLFYLLYGTYLLK